MVVFRTPSGASARNYITAAANVGSNAASIIDTVERNSPDYDQMAADALASNQRVKNALFKQAANNINVSENAESAIRLAKQLRGGIRPEQPMAGRLAARTKGWIDAINTEDPKEPFTYDYSAFEKLLKDQQDQINEQLKTIKSRKFVPLEIPNYSISGDGEYNSTVGESGDFVGGQLPKSTVNAIKTTADNLGVDVYSLGGLFEMESGHRPNVWGGAGGNYYGIIQWGDYERKEAGLDPSKIANLNYTIEEQLPHVEKWLKGRGFIPGKHGTTELYRTVLVGNPYESGTDSNLTNSDTAAEQMKPGGALYRRAQKLYGNFEPITETSTID